MKYRIKIEEKYNGEKEYVPQVRVGGFFSSWHNLLYDTLFVRVDVDADVSQSWRTIDKAKEVIDLHKKQVEKKQGEKVKTVTYIKV